MKGRFKYFSLSAILLVGFLGCDLSQEDLTNGPSAKVDAFVEGNGNILGSLEDINKGRYTPNKHIANTGINVVLPKTRELKKSLEDLSESTKLYCEYLGTIGETADDLLPASFESTREVFTNKIKDNWTKAIRIFHFIEGFQFGPLTKISLTDAYTISDRIYSFPRSNFCGVDLEIALDLTDMPNYKLRDNENYIGLDVLEPLIFGKDSEHRCLDADNSNDIQEWLAKPKSKRLMDRCHYMKLVTEQLVEKGSKLEMAWSLTSGNYTGKMLQDSLSTRPFKVIGEISNSLFFLEEQVKDRRIGLPSGIVDCENSSCPERAEHLFSNESIPSAIESLKGFYAAFNGGEGFGFDDLLRLRGFRSVAEEMNAATLKAINNLEKIKSSETVKSLSENIDARQCSLSTSDDRKVEICAIYMDIRGIAELLKNDFVSSLAEITAPKESQGDAD